MKHLRTLTALSALALAVPAAAFADTILLASYGTGLSSLSLSNTATFYSPSTSKVNSLSTNTYDIDPGSTWHAALPNSSYVSFDPTTAPSGTYVAPNGDYFYSTSFVLSPFDAAAGIATLSVLADDTVSIYLNGTLILAAAIPIGPSNTYAHCSDSGPNCNVPTTFNFGGLLAGNNVLTFDVQQVNFAYTGLDYSGSIVAVPEPASLALLGTGLLGIVSLLHRRQKMNRF